MVKLQNLKNLLGIILFVSSATGKNIEFELHKTQAEIYFSSGNYTEAIAKYDFLLQQRRISKKLYLELLYKKGIAFEKLHQYEKAIEIYKECIRKDKKNTQFHLSLGKVYENTALYSQAIEEYKKVIKLKKASIKDKFTAYSALGRVYHSIGLTSDAIKNFKQAMILTPTGITSQEIAKLYWYLSKCYEKLHNWELASSMLKQSVTLNPNVDDYLHLAFLYSLEKKYTDTVETLRIAVDKAPERVDIKYHLSAAYFKQKDYTSARNLLKVLSEIYPEDPLVHFLNGFVYYFEKNYEFSYKAMKDSKRLAKTPMLKKYSEFIIKELEKKLKKQKGD